MPTPKARYDIVAEDKTGAAWASSINNAKKFNNELNNMFKGAASFAGMSIGINQVGDALGKAIQRGDGLLRLSERMGTTVEYLSKLEYGAAKADVEFDKLTGGLDTMSKNVSMAAQGMGKAQQALKDLGLNAKELNRLPLDRRLEVIADAMAGLGNASDRTRVSMQLFGDANFVSIFGDGADAVKEFVSQAEKAGHVMSTLTARELAAADDAMKELNATWKDLTATAAVFWVGVAKDAGMIPTSEIEQYNNKLNELFAKIEKLQQQRNTFREDGSFANAFPDTAKKHYDDLTVLIDKTRANLDALAKEKYTKFEMPKSSDGGEKRRNLDPSTQDELNDTYDYFEKLGKKQEDYNAQVDKATDELRTAWGEYYQGIYQLSISSTQKEGEQLKARLDANRVAFEAGLKDRQQFEDDAMAITEEAGIKEFNLNEINARRVSDTDKATAAEISEYQKNLIRNTQSILADFMIDGFQDGARGVVITFARMIANLQAQAAAAKLTEYLFGTANTTSNSDSNRAAAQNGLLNSLFGYLSGARADGGPVGANKSYLVGERGPEIFTPGASGMISPNSALRSSNESRFAPVYNINIGAGNAVTRGEVATALEQSRKATVATMRELKRQGRF